MKRFIVVALAFAMVFGMASTTRANETAELLKENVGGVNGSLRAAPSAAGNMQIELSAGADTTVAIDFDNLDAGVSYEMLLYSGTSGGEDSCWTYKWNATRTVRADSALWISEPNMISPLPIVVAHGDTIRIKVGSTGGEIWARLHANGN